MHRVRGACQPDTADLASGAVRAWRCARAPGDVARRRQRDKVGTRCRGRTGSRRAITGGSVRVLVTGHEGYLGAVLVPLLRAAGHEVVGFDTGYYAGCDFGHSPEPVATIGRDIRDARRRPRGTWLSSSWPRARTIPCHGKPENHRDQSHAPSPRQAERARVSQFPGSLLRTLRRAASVEETSPSTGKPTASRSRREETRRGPGFSPFSAQRTASNIPSLPGCYQQPRGGRTQCECAPERRRPWRPLGPCCRSRRRSSSCSAYREPPRHVSCRPRTTIIMMIRLANSRASARAPLTSPPMPNGMLVTTAQ